MSEALWELESQTPRVLLYVFRQRDKTQALSSIASCLLLSHPLPKRHGTERRGGITVSEVLLDLSTASECVYVPSCLDVLPYMDHVLSLLVQTLYTSSTSSEDEAVEPHL